MSQPEPTARAEARRDGAQLVVAVAGDWQITEDRPQWATLVPVEAVTVLRFDGAGLAGWDSSLALFLREAKRWAEAHGVAVELHGFPRGVDQILAAMAQVDANPGKAAVRPDLFTTVGLATLALWQETKELSSLVGECAFSTGRFLKGKAQFRWRDSFAEMQACGLMALPIVSLISFLIGVILAYQGAVQLRQYGADIYVADMVGLAVVREMGPLMVAIVLAGRTGAAFAATIGNMKANEEIDALETLGVSRVDFLVMPRITALCVMMPLLTLYANGLGLLGGMMIAKLILDIPANAYWIETQSWVDLSDLSTGLIKAATFGLLVGVAGCLRGLQAERSAAGVGSAATSAVVTGILLIIVADAIFAVAFNILGW